MDADLCLTKNVGDADRLIRAALAFVLIAAPPVLGFTGWWVAVLATVGGAQFFAAMTGY